MLAPLMVAGGIDLRGREFYQVMSWPPSPRDDFHRIDIGIAPSEAWDPSYSDHGVHDEDQRPRRGSGHGRHRRVPTPEQFKNYYSLVLLVLADRVVPRI